MSFATRLVRLALSNRLRQIENFRQNPIEVQEKQFQRLLEQGRYTAFGRDYNFASINSSEDFAAKVPVTEYDIFYPYIERMRHDEENVLWPKKIEWFAKSSGTTSAASKFIPVSKDGLRESHMRGPIDVMAIYTDTFPDSKVFNGKTLTLGGSHTLDRFSKTAHSGDISAIMIENVPVGAQCKREPSKEIALITDFEEKVKAICEHTTRKSVTAFAGAPSWNLVMIKRILEYTGKESLREVWPDLELFIHGGMSFAPYREQYYKLVGGLDVIRYMETYNASEGFFAIQDDLSKDDMLLMLDYGVYYEFLPVDSLNDMSKTVPLAGVKEGCSYAIIITTSSGLWRYMIGDTVEFTSVNPYRIRITGRTKLFINAFGEEIIIDNAERAIKAACEATGAVVAEYTAAPVYMDDRGKGAHEWAIEFEKEPSSMGKFTETLDETLKILNSDYQAKRYKDMTLFAPEVVAMKQGTFYRWLESRGKVGGQNKVPRLSNNRTIIEQVKSLS